MSAEVLRDGADEAVVEALFELPPTTTRSSPASAASACRPAARRAGRAAGPARGAARRPRPGLRQRRAGHGLGAGRGAARRGRRLRPARARLAPRRGDPPLAPRRLRRARRAGRAASAPLLARYRETFGRLSALCRERDSLQRDEAERGRRADYLAFQLKELDAVDPKPGEDAALDAERRVLASAEKLREAARLGGGAGLRRGRQRQRAGGAGGPGAHRRRGARPAARRHRSSCSAPRSSSSTEAGRELGRYAETVGGDGERLQVIEDRLEALKALCRKHGGSLEAAVARRAEMAAELGLADRRRRAARGAGQPEIDAAGAEAATLAGMITQGPAEGGQGLLRRGRGGALRAGDGPLPAGGGLLAAGGRGGGGRGAARPGRRRAGALPARPQPGRAAAAAGPHRLGRRALALVAGGEADAGAPRPGPHLRLRRGRLGHRRRRGRGHGAGAGRGGDAAGRSSASPTCRRSPPSPTATTGSSKRVAAGRTTSEVALLGRPRSSGRRWRG